MNVFKLMKKLKHTNAQINKKMVKYVYAVLIFVSLNSNSKNLIFLPNLNSKKLF